MKRDIRVSDLSGKEIPSRSRERGLRGATVTVTFWDERRNGFAFEVTEGEAEDLITRGSAYGGERKPPIRSFKAEILARGSLIRG